MSKLAVLIATEEGFFIPGSLPERDNNPGDLRHSPHSFHPPGDPNAIGDIDTPADGWTDLETQLNRFANRGLTLEQMVRGLPAPASIGDPQHPIEYVGGYAPASDGNDTEGYIDFLCRGLGCGPATLVKDALLIT